MELSSTGAPLPVDLSCPPDLTDALQRYGKRIIGNGAFGTVYRCFCTLNGEVAIKAITFHNCTDQTERDVFVRKMKRELGIWRRLDHPNIVPLLGRAHGEDFGSNYPCLVSMWMPHGTLAEYVKQRGTMLLPTEHMNLIKGSVSGLQYLHSKQIIHGDLHPGNILIDGQHNARLTDLGFSQTVRPMEGLSYLWTNSVLPGAAIWAAPELLYPSLYPDLKFEATLNSDIYSLGTTILFILSKQLPWSSRTEAESKLKEFQNPPRPVWPAKIPDGVWDLIERCWSPRHPRNRPSAQEVLSFASDKLEELLQPNLPSVINVVLFGPLGCGKSSIINLLAEQPIAQVSMDAEPCTKRPQSHEISIGERRFQLWDTMGFHLADGGDTSPLSPYEQAHAVLRDLPGNGVNLILLCVDKDTILPSLGSFYYLINDFFYRGRAPIAFVVTHSDAPDEQWWERNQQIIAQRTGIPVQSLPHACTTTVQTGRGQSKEALKSLLQTYATANSPISPNLDLSDLTNASYNLTTHCRLGNPEATALLEKFRRPPCLFNVVFFGDAGAGMSSVINLIVGHPVAQVSSAIDSCTTESRSYMVNIGTRHFLAWDTIGLTGVHVGDERSRRATDNAARLIRSLSRKGGVDLLVFCKKSGRLTPSELDNYTYFEKSLCKGQVPVAVIITHLESVDPMEKWWDLYGEGVLKAIGGNVIGHACITSLASDNPNATKFSQKLLESRLSVQAMLEDCVSFRSTSTHAKVGGIPAKSPSKRAREAGRMQRRIPVKCLRERYALSREVQGPVAS